MYDLNECIRSLNVGLPDDIARLKAAGYYKEAIARIDRLLAEDWTKTQNSPATNGSAAPEGYVPPENPTPHGVDALREALTVQKEIMRRLPREYCWTEAEAIARMQERVKGFTAEEFRALDWEGRMDWRFVEGEKRYQERFAETLLATHADLAARKKTPDAPNNKNEERHRLCEKMMQEGSASADITLRTSIRMSDEAFAAALEKARKRLHALGLDNRATFAVADGLAALDALKQPPDTVFVLGMGGETIGGILRRGHTRLGGAALILGAQTDLPMVRRTVCEVGYRIRSEVIASAGGRDYVLMRCTPARADEAVYTERECMLGPGLLRDPSSEWQRVLKRREHLLQQEISAMEKAGLEKDRERLAMNRRELGYVTGQLRHM